MTPKEKFQNYFNLKDGFHIEGDHISGDCVHEGQYVEFQIYIDCEDEIWDFDEKYFKKYDYNNDPERVDGWLEHCRLNWIGFYLEVYYDGNHEFEWDIEDYILKEAVYEYDDPYLVYEVEEQKELKTA